MVLGLFEGGMDISLEKRNFRVGDEIKGTAILKAKKPVEARAFMVSLYKKIKRNSYDNQMHSEKVLYGTIQLGGKKEYESCEIPFKINAPDVFSGNPLGFLFGPINSVFGQNIILEAKLDMEGKFDIRKEISINIKP